MYTYKAKIIGVVDGDTVDAIIDLGFKVKIKHRLRLLGIDTPEMHGEDKKHGQLAKQYVKNELLNKEVMIKSRKSDSFGRWLATIYIEDLDFNNHLIEKGYAVPYA